MKLPDLTNDHLENIRTLFIMAIRKRLMANRKIGCLLSGGLDSSLVASLLVEEARKANLPYKIQVRHFLHISLMLWFSYFCVIAPLLKKNYLGAFLWYIYFPIYTVDRIGKKQCQLKS